jgi:hypothetical protein
MFLCRLTREKETDWQPFSWYGGELASGQWTEALFSGTEHADSYSRKNNPFLFLCCVDKILWLEKKKHIGCRSRV